MHGRRAMTASSPTWMPPRICSDWHRSRAGASSFRLARLRGLESHQLGTLADLFADGDVEGLADAIRGSAGGVLHLHRLEDQQRLALGDARAGFHEQRHYAAR